MEAAAIDELYFDAGEQVILDDVLPTEVLEHLNEGAPLFDEALMLMAA